ncbi:ATP-binding protein [Komagataeibacter sucrofermentans]|uniref:Adenylate kinase n=1 Tax=Komagataeibacter sucrofermentans TaxID=1053551 RepID=A0A318QJ17_9PROT|nr:AAA family ATPase [Komagataeibacter sucrofermentans]PYD77471.1 adenylate kinase [Komagataeibacter sucrofermentans]GBQ49194.1 adenylate kinase [Komagataeibacter sucrofermentans DSM 15973]
MNRRIALLGLSGAGKSTLIESLKKITPLCHLQASNLIKAEQLLRVGQKASSEELRTGPIVDNQQLLIAAFKREAENSNIPIILDAHSVIDGKDGLVEIPSTVFGALGLDAICFLHVNPAIIVQRRQGDKQRERPLRDVESLTRQQRIAYNAAKRIAADIGCPLTTIEDNNVEKLRYLIQ